MGYTHALSGVAALSWIALAVWLLSIDLTPVLGSTHPAVIALSCVVVLGGIMLPDADNSHSKFHSTFGLVAEVISIVFRTTSEIIQTTIRSDRDDKNPNPHRGFYHTIVGACLVGFLIVVSIHVNLFTVNLPYFGKVGSGFLVAMIVSWMSFHIAVATIAADFVSKTKRSSAFGELIILAGTVAGTLAMYSMVPRNSNPQWIGVSLALGMVLHQLGDCWTKMGCPILFPFKIRGKRWYQIRFAMIETNGDFEKKFLSRFMGLLAFAPVAILVFLSIQNR